ncbi:hypothetical protein [Streptomyces sp. NPDC102487]|uniref:hypothetical protein n=1 Tax=Streptomyces sp. NPDC102487 TaxID=3366182 RepID=UPI003820F47E
MRTVDEWWVAARVRQAWRHAVAWALLGVALLAAAAGPGAYVPERVAAERAFLEAKPCRVDGREPARADCLRTIRGTVWSAGSARNGRTTVFRVELKPPVPAPADRPLDLDAHGDLSELIEPGDTVEVTTWRDVRVAVGHDGVRETLPGLPDEDAAVLVGLTLVCVWSAVLALLAAFGSARRARRLTAGRPVAPRVRFGVAKAVGVVAVPIGTAILAGRLWDTWAAVVMTVIVSALVAVPATITALNWDRDADPLAPSGTEHETDVEPSRAP